MPKLTEPTNDRVTFEPKSLSQHLCPSKLHATGSGACETGKDWDESVQHPPRMVRKLSFQEFVHLVQTRKVGFYVNKAKLNSHISWVFMERTRSWARSQRFKFWNLMSFHWSLLFSVLYLNNWIDNIFISEVSLKIRLGNEGEIIKKKTKTKTVKHCPGIIILILTNT